MCQNVNIIVYIWSPNLAICAIAKIGGCTQLIMGSKNWSYTSSDNDGILPKGPYPPYLCMPFWQDTLEMACHLMTPSHCLNWSWFIIEVWRHSADRECSRYQSLKCVRILQQHLIGVNELKNHRSWLYSLFLIIIELLCGKIQLFQHYQ